jgi:hypothetical protein
MRQLTLSLVLVLTGCSHQGMVIQNWQGRRSGALAERQGAGLLNQSPQGEVGSTPSRSAILTSATVERNDFVPIDIGHASAMACMLSAVDDATLFGPDGAPYAETQVFVNYAKAHGSKKWDFQPIVSRRDNVLTAIDDCIKWYEDVKKQIKATAADSGASKKP